MNAKLIQDRGVTLGFFEVAKKDYTRIPIREQVEVLSMVGNIALDDKGETSWA